VSHLAELIRTADAAITERITADILKLVKECDYVTLAEVSRIPGVTADTGTPYACGLGMGEQVDVLFWSNLTPEGSLAVGNVIGLHEGERQVDVTPGNVLAYVMDGATLDLPVATPRKVRAKRAKPASFWAPICLRPLGRAPEKNLLKFRKETP
jgi:hypothetical protein